MREILFDKFYNYTEMVDFLEEVQKDNKDFVKIASLTETPEGRKIFLVEITDFSTGSASEKSAYYIQAGLHAQEVAGTTAALHIIKTLLDNEHKDMLKKIAFYIVPRVNADGSEYALSTHGQIRSRYEKMEIKNGLIPQDINGDGCILSMRWKDPAGSMKEDEVDPRLMVRRKPGDKKGPFYHVAEEGLIQDYDGTNIVSGVRTIDFNRNYPIGWQSSTNASFYPFSEPEMKAVGDFLVHTPNIFAGVDFHCGNCSILYPYVQLYSQADQKDLELILNIGRLAESITGFPLIHECEYKEAWKANLPIHGDSNEWSYFKMGISHYVIELGNGFNCAGISTREYFEADSDTRETVFMRRILKYHDMNKSQIFVPWKEFKHPQLGVVEIGGLMGGNGYYMHPSVMKDIAPKTTEFVLRHAEMHPELIVSNIDALHIEKGIFRIRANVSNIGGLGTNVMNSGGSYDSRKPVKVKLLFSERIELLSRINTFEFDKSDALEDMKCIEWFVKAEEGDKAIIEASHPRGGVFRKEVVL